MKFFDKNITIGFTGTQTGMTTLQYAFVKKILNTYKENISTCHHGDCIGADADFHDICESLELTIVIHPPDIDVKRAFKKALDIRPEKPYLNRNQDIVNECDILIATPKEKFNVLRSGTWSTIRYAKRKHKSIIICYPDGKYDRR